MAVSAGTQITDLTVDDHACLTYGEPEELLDLTAAFVRDGLASGLKVIWVTEDSPKTAAAELTQRGALADMRVAEGQMAALGPEGRLLSGQAFTADEAMSWLGGEITASQRAGFAGLRVALDMGWALQPVAGIEELPQFEQDVAAHLAGTQVSVLCQYDRERFDPVTLATITAIHTRSVAAATYHADAKLRICRQYAPPGIRLAGEIDYQAEEPLALALAEAIRLDGNVTVNMAGLAFIDAACTRMILDAAATLAASRKVTLRAPAPLTGQFRRFGAGDVAGISLVSADAR